MSPEVRIRPAVAGDSVRLAVLGAQVWMHTYATDGVSQVIAEYVQRELSNAAMLSLLADPVRHVVVAEAGVNLLGYAVISFSARCPQERDAHVELVTLHVQEHFSRQRIGSELLKYAERSASERASHLWLTVNARNVPAIAFYDLHGYVRVGTAYFELGGEKYENHVLTKRRV